MKYPKMKDSGVEWIGEMPRHWQISPAHQVFTEVKTKNAEGAITKALKFFNGTIVPKANFDASSDEYVAETIANYMVVEPDTIVINGLNLNYDLKSLRVAIVEEAGVITSAYLAVWPQKDLILPRYATFLLKGYEAKMAFHNMGSGIRKTLGFKEFKRQPILLPPLSEQAAIADFLDDKCGAIDSIITEAKAGIEEYKAWKASVIFEAVTKGLDPNAEMKDSGVEWIGQIPAGWSVCKVKHLCSMQAGKNLTSEEIEDTGSYPVYGGNGLRGFYSSFNQDRQCVLVGRQGALCGNVHFVKGRFWATDHAVVTLPTSAEDCKHLYYLLGCMNLNQYASETTAQPGLSVSLVQNLPSILTPLQEQVAIAAYLDDKCSAIDSIIAEKEALIAELETYKKSLIFETVTGKRRVC